MCHVSNTAVRSTTFYRSAVGRPNPKKLRNRTPSEFRRPMRRDCRGQGPLQRVAVAPANRFLISPWARATDELLAPAFRDYDLGMANAIALSARDLDLRHV